MSDVWTIKKTLDWGTGYFEKQGIESPRLNIEYLLAEVLHKKNRIDLYVEFERSLNPDELQTLKTSIQRRAKREPLQYILGYVEFFNARYQVNPAVLIPRPETELFVEKVNTLIQQYFLESTKIKLLDLGAGSGCLGLSILKSFIQGELTAIDASEKAIECARENAEALGLTGRTHFFTGNWLEPLPEEEKATFDVIVSNPPYVTEAEFDQLQPEVKDFEPKEALVAGPTGLEMYEQMIPAAVTYLKEKGLLGFEVGMGQAEKVKKIMEENELNAVEIYSDLNDIPRMVIGFKNG